MNKWSHHDVRLVCMWLFLSDAGGLKVRAEGGGGRGGCVGTTLQTASHGSGMPFESL